MDFFNDFWRSDLLRKGEYRPTIVIALSMMFVCLPREKVYFRSQILERPSIGEYWNISGVPVLSENVIFTFFRTGWCYSEAYNTGIQKLSSIVQYSCTSIWDFKYTFSFRLYESEVYTYPRGRPNEYTYMLSTEDSKLYVEWYLFINGWQLAKMKKSIPDMSLP